MHSRIALSLFGFIAAFGMVLVQVTDPSGGAVASPYYQGAAPRLSERAAQLLNAQTSANVAAVKITRDNYTVTEKPPPPPPAPVARSSSGSNYAVPVAVADPGSAKAIAAEMVAARGWGTEQFDCLVALWNKESGWRVNALNPSSGAYGIPQALPGSKMASAGADWQTSASTQITWGLGYISGRYGTPCGAWQSSVDRGWY